MPQQTDAATPTKIRSIDESLVGRKMRVAGRMLAYEPITEIMLLADGDVGLLVNVRLCTGNSAEWGRERKGVVMVLGYLERVDKPTPIPVLPAYFTRPLVDPCLVLDALLVTAVADLDLTVWNNGIDAMDHLKL